MGVEPVCHALQVAPSTYYGAQARPPSARARRDAELGPQLRGAVGAELLGLWAAQAVEGGPARRHRGGTGPSGPADARPWAARSHPGEEAVHHQAGPSAARAPDLLHRDFTATAPDQKWVADFTYCSTWSGIVYVAFVADMFSRRIVGWKAARSIAASLVVDALNMAAWTRRHTTLAGLVCHSDAGSQYTSLAYTERLAEIGAAPSIGTVGDSYDNALAQTTIGLFKTELHRNPAALAANGGPWRGLDDLETATCAWTAWFNTERLHSELGDRTPAEIEDSYREDPQPTAA